MKKKIIKLPKTSKKVKIIISVVLLCCLVVGGIAIARNSASGDGTYRETQALYGNLTVGITESGTVDIGTVEQTFELDMSALTRVTTTNSNSSSSSSSSGFGGGMSGGMGGMGGGNSSGGSNATDMFGQMFNMGGNSSSSSSSTNSSSDSKLVVESVLVSVGQEIKAGDVILTLEQDGVDELKTELEENTQKASADLDALIADQELSRITAEYTLNTALAYGEYAETERTASINSLKQDIQDAQDTLEAAKKSLSRYKEQLEQAKKDYENAVTAYNSAVWVRDNVDKATQLYTYTVAFTDAQSAESTVKNLENKIDQLESRIEQAESNVERAESNVAKAKRNYESGYLSAQETYEIRMLAYNTAQETYDITISYLEDDLAKQQETYDDAVEKWNEFTSYIDGVNVISDYSGVITGVSLAKGDKLNSKATVITLYDKENVTMTVTVSEDDIASIEVGGAANISLTAYPDEIFEATVSEISDATTDNSGNTTRDVTVTIKGDLSKLFQGMTGEVTFITKQNAEVLYVSNRAIIRENGYSYVKVKDENGKITKVKVVTGFSDGINVEIKEGLSEGQTVIIEKGDTK